MGGLCWRSTVSVSETKLTSLVELIRLMPGMTDGWEGRVQYCTGRNVGPSCYTTLRVRDSGDNQQTIFNSPCFQRAGCYRQALHAECAAPRNGLTGQLRPSPHCRLRGASSAERQEKGLGARDARWGHHERCPSSHNAEGSNSEQSRYERYKTLSSLSNLAYALMLSIRCWERLELFKGEGSGTPKHGEVATKREAHTERRRGVEEIRNREAVTWVRER